MGGSVTFPTNPIVDNGSFCTSDCTGLPTSMHVRPTPMGRFEVKPLEGGGLGYGLGNAVSKIYHFVQNFFSDLLKFNIPGASASEIEKRAIVERFVKSCKVTKMGNCTIPYPSVDDLSNKVIISGDLAFVVRNLNLLIIDIKNLSKPILKGRFDYPKEINTPSAAALKDLVFIADGEAGFQIVDGLDPSNPSLIGYFNSSKFDADAIKVTSDSKKFPIKAYTVGNIGDNGKKPIFSSIDVKNPLAPFLEEEYKNFSKSTFLNDLDVVKDLAFVAGNPSGLTILNLLGKSPSFVSEFSMPEDTPNARYVKVIGDTAFILASGFSSDVLCSVDISDPVNPKLKDRFDIPNAYNIAFSEKYAFVFSSNPEPYYTSLSIIGLSNPSKLTWAGSYKSQNGDEMDAVGVGEDGFVYITITSEKQLFHVLKVDCS